MPPFNLGNDLAPMLREAQRIHHESEKDLPAHDWVEWYASYIWLRASGYTSEWSAKVADRVARDAAKEKTNS